MRPGDRVLDVGCGTGVVTLALPAAVGPRGAVVGLDLLAGVDGLGDKALAVNRGVDSRSW